MFLSAHKRNHSKYQIIENTFRNVELYYKVIVLFFRLSKPALAYVFEMREIKKILTYLGHLIFYDDAFHVEKYEYEPFKKFVSIRRFGVGVGVGGVYYVLLSTREI